MANRRMFSRTVTGSGRFLRLSVQSRVLYYDLGMEADDDGFVEAYARLLVTGSQPEHLLELERAGFITVCDWDCLVVYIRDWKQNNLIRADRYTPSVYRDSYAQIMNGVEKNVPLPCPVQPAQRPEPTPEAEPVNQPEVREDTRRQQDGCFLGDSRLTQVRLGKDRLEEGRKEKGSTDKVRANQANSIQFISHTDSSENRTTRAPAREDEKSASPIPGEADMEFVKKRGVFIEMLMNPEHCRNSRASPSGVHPV